MTAAQDPNKLGNVPEDLTAVGGYPAIRKTEQDLPLETLPAPAARSASPTTKDSQNELSLFPPHHTLVCSSASHRGLKDEESLARWPNLHLEVHELAIDLDNHL